MNPETTKLFENQEGWEREVKDADTELDRLAYVGISEREINKEMLTAWKYNDRR